MAVDPASPALMLAGEPLVRLREGEAVAARRMAEAPSEHNRFSNGKGYAHEATLIWCGSGVGVSDDGAACV